MFDKLIDVCLQFAEDLIPFGVVQHYNRAVRMRFGKPRGVLQPGFHWKIPFADVFLEQMVKTKTINLSEQTITTKDWIGVVVRAVIKYEVEDVEKLLLEVYDPFDAVADMTKGIIRSIIITRDWADCNSDKLSSDIARKARVEGKQWGVKIIEVTLTDLGKVPSFRLFNSSDSKNE
jgi:regulator of protease activity HflC (stomatin/prohibitin superfamily)